VRGELPRMPIPPRAYIILMRATAALLLKGCSLGYFKTRFSIIYQLGKSSILEDGS